MKIAAMDRVANDWVVLGLANSDQGDGLVGTEWLFQFYSANARVACTYGFVGLGVGAAVGLLPVDVTQPQNGARINGWRGFSAGNLDGAGGMVINAGWDAFGRSGGILKITAFDWQWISYFSYQSVPGPNSGLGLGLSWNDGRWMLLSMHDLWTGQRSNALTLKPSLGKKVSLS